MNTDKTRSKNLVKEIECMEINLFSEKKKQFQTELVKMEEDLIREAISFALGSDNWKLADISGRCNFISARHHKYKLFCFDGIPMLKIWPPVISNESSCSVYKFSSKQPYEKLYKINKK